ncbi:MAG: FliM/FliN family flagellar motor switch protein [Thermoguttaceae bacterium]
MADVRTQTSSGVGITSLRQLPLYSRSLLRVRVPVVVTLARNRQPLSRIVEIGPGALIHFEKSCEEALELEVGGRTIALGQAVKVGDKFGLRVTSIALPEERFAPVKKNNA